MSRSRARIGAALALGATLLAAPGTAQAQEEPREALVQHLDTLYPLLVEAVAARDRAQAVADSLARVHPAQPQDTVRAGLLTLVTYPGQTGLARSVADEVWSDLEGMVSRSPALEGTTFFFNWSYEQRPLNLTGRVYEISAPAWLPRTMLRENAREAVGAALGLDVPEPFLRWTAQWNVRPPRDPGGVYRELVAHGAQANQACLRRELEGCWTALGLGLSGDPLRHWYAPEEAAELAASLHTDWLRRSWWYGTDQREPLGDRCIAEAERGLYESCWAFLEKYRGRVPSPLGYAARQAMAWIALERGGDGAFDRLRADPTLPPEEALLAASGLTRDELSAAWLDWVLAHRPAVYSGLPATRWLALFWFIFFGLLALRSKRWRLG